MAEYVVRVKWSQGFVDVSDGGTGERVTTFVDAGLVRTLAAAQEIGQAVLDTLAGPRTTYTVDIADPLAVYQVGDTITFPLRSGTASAKVTARRMDMDRNGWLRPVLTLADPGDVLAERQQLAIRRATNGTVGGRAAGATPVQGVDLGVPAGPLRAPTLQAFAWSGGQILLDSASPDQFTESELVVMKVTIASAPSAFSGAITAGVYRNGTLTRSVTLPASGTIRSVLAGGFVCQAGDRIGCRLTAVGASITDEEKSPRRVTVQLTCAPAMVETKAS